MEEVDQEKLEAVAAKLGVGRVEAEARVAEVADDLREAARAVALAAARPAVRDALMAALISGDIEGAKREALRSEIEYVAPDLGYLRTKLPYRDGQTREVGYFMRATNAEVRRGVAAELELGTATYSLDAEVAPLRAAITEEAWPKFQELLGKAIVMTSLVYAEEARTRAGLLADLARGLGCEPAELSLLAPSRETGTLTLCAGGRVLVHLGIYIIYPDT